MIKDYTIKENKYLKTIEDLITNKKVINVAVYANSNAHELIHKFIEMDYKNIEIYRIYTEKDSFTDLVSHYKKEIDVVIIICEESYYILKTIMNTLYENKMSNVWYIPSTYVYQDLGFSGTFEEFLTYDCCYCGYEEGQIHLKYIEMQLADQCNLNCVGCSHYSPLYPANAPFPSYKMYKRDLKRLSQLFASVMQIRLMGGEPLLNPKINCFLDITRKIFPFADIRVITNGLLIPKLSDNILNNIKRNRVIVDISGYAPTLLIQNDIEATLAQHHIVYNFIGKTNSFCKRLAVSTNMKGLTYKCTCDYDSYNVRDGKISKCPVLAYINKLNTEFIANFPEDNIFDIHDENLTGLELYKMLNQKASLCNYCVDEEIPWETYGNRNRKLSDWVIGIER